MSYYRENILCEPTTAISLDEKTESSDEDENILNISTSDIENVEDPLDKVKPGLRFEGDSLVPLQSVHIRAKLLDLCAKVVVMQVYNNSSSKPIEAKYVFPLDDMAAGKFSLYLYFFRYLYLYLNLHGTVYRFNLAQTKCDVFVQFEIYMSSSCNIASNFISSYSTLYFLDL